MAQGSEPVDAAAVMRALPIDSYVISVWVNGLYACIAMLTVWALLYRSQSYHRRGLWLAVVIALFTSSTINTGLCWGLLTHSVQYYGTTPQLVNVLDQQRPWYRGFANALFAFNTVIADGLFVWRCWVIWEHSWLAVAFPIASTLAGTIFCILSQIGQIEEIPKAAAGTLPSKFISLSTPYFALSLVTTVYTAAMITFRVIRIQRQARSAGQFSQNYSKMLEILVESALLYSATTLILVVLFALKLQALSYMEAIQAQSSGIAPTLIILRVALGHARPDDQWTTKSTTATNVIFTTIDSTKTVEECAPSRRTQETPDHFSLPVCTYSGDSCATDTDNSIKKEEV